ncbi:deacetylase [Planobispora rosea]|uniref:Deacetylase n=1 Tax=Planobispora rosea TaxID=35762 RepID=A0A8J3S2C2_PLARO|nr:polysaccharide deacetylase family protein [Planobispora rosea]GGS59105.1 deacetylase [Planobispora rosea]GIH84666.1 deacetylase [Planobispora rosea]
MQVWAVPLAMALGLGLGGTAVPPIDPPADPARLARQLAAIQSGWPQPRHPVPPPARGVDCAEVKCVALTFDDGPGEHTGALLDVLAEHRARATFFVIGVMVEENGGGDLRRMVAEGHELGNHSWSHAQLTALSRDGIASELDRTQKIVERETGVRMVLMRPPYGATDGRVAAESRSRGLSQILWDVDTLDWRDRDSAVVVRRAGEAAPGSIVLMHDIHRTTIDAVPELLEDLAAEDYTFVTLSELYGRKLTPGKRYLRR